MSDADAKKYADVLTTLEQLIDLMRQEDRYGERWAMGADFFLSDCRDYLASEED